MQMKHIAITAIIVVCASISYYFLIALPHQNEARLAIEKQKLDMEKDKIEREQTEKQQQENLKAYSQSQRQSQLLDCRVAAEASANRYLELNGTPVPGKPGVYSAPRYVHDEVAKKQQRGFDDCQRMYGDFR
jgi:Tfp pilus assembly protein PilE